MASTTSLLRYLTGTSPTLGGILRARAVILLDECDLSPSAAGVASGHNHSYFTRRLDGRKTASTPCRLLDLEALATAGDFDAVDLLSPVLIRGDGHLLQYIGQQKELRAEELDVFADVPGCLARLLSQWLITYDGHFYTLTPAGESLARTLETRP